MIPKWTERAEFLAAEARSLQEPEAVEVTWDEYDEADARNERERGA